MPELKNLIRCKAPLGGGECGSAVFYDWGLVLATEYHYAGISGSMPRYDGSVQTDNIKICARCTTPYVVEGGEFVSVGSELSAEDVKGILTRGQAQLPHPKIKDP